MGITSEMQLEQAGREQLTEEQELSEAFEHALAREARHDLRGREAAMIAQIAEREALIERAFDRYQRERIKSPANVSTPDVDRHAFKVAARELLAIIAAEPKRAY